MSGPIPRWWWVMRALKDRCFEDRRENNMSRAAAWWYVLKVILCMAFCAPRKGDIWGIMVAMADHHEHYSTPDTGSMVTWQELYVGEGITKGWYWNIGWNEGLALEDQDVQDLWQEWEKLCAKEGSDG